LAAFVAFAFSNRVFIGSWLVFSFEVPGWLQTTISQFRSSGRFIWVPTYVLVFFLVARVARWGKRGGLVLAFAAILQVVDVIPHFGWIHDLYGAPDEAFIDPAVWDHTLARHTAVWSFPSFDCAWTLRGGWDDPNYKTLYQLAYRSALKHKTVNSIHDARPGRDCLDDVRDRESITVRPDTLVVYMRRAATGQMLDRVAAQGARCLPFDRGFACASSFDDSEVHAFESSAAKSRYDVGSWIVFGGDGSVSAPFEGGAWGIKTREGAYVGWPVEGSRSTLHFVLDRPRYHSHDVELEVDAEPGQNLAPTDIRVETAGAELDAIRLAPGTTITIRRKLKPAVRGRDAWVSLDLFEAPPTTMGGPRARLRIKRARLLEHVCAKSTKAEVARSDSADDGDVDD
jgi:hypothetical protein